MDRKNQIHQLQIDWHDNNRWKNTVRPYSAQEVVSLRGSTNIEYTLAKKGAIKFWNLLHEPSPVCALGAVTGNQAIQQVQAGLKAIYCSGWQVAGDNNTSGSMYPDQSLYPVDSVPKLVEKINNACVRMDEIKWQSGIHSQLDCVPPIIADAEAGFGGNLNAYELMKHMIKAGAACVHYEDQLASAKKCGHLGGKVLVSTQEAINKLVAARLAADVMGVPTCIIARTDANAANLITTDIDERDKPFLTGERSIEGFYFVRSGLEQAISRGLSYAPYADLIWCETSQPDLIEAKLFATAILEHFPDKILAYNCSPSFNWAKNLDENTMKVFREKLFKIGYKYQFITLAGWHSLNIGMFELSKAYKEDGMWAYSKLQERELKNEQHGFEALKHQTFVGTGYFDSIQNTITQGGGSTLALPESTEVKQFYSKL